jgi:hypothetical protein
MIHHVLLRPPARDFPADEWNIIESSARHAPTEGASSCCAVVTWRSPPLSVLAGPVIHVDRLAGDEAALARNLAGVAHGAA